MQLLRRDLLKLGAGALLAGAGPAVAIGPDRRGLRFLKVRHATFLVEIGGRRALVDPWFGKAFGGPLLSEASAPALAPDEVGEPDLLLVTLGTPDRFDLFGLRKLRSREPYCLVPSERCARGLRSAGFRRVRVVRPGDRWEILGVDVEVAPARDDLFGDGVGYRLAASGRSVWHTGSPLPLDVDGTVGRWARERETELLLAAWDPGAGSSLAVTMGPDDAYLLARLSRARFLVPQGDGLQPSWGIAAAVESVVGAAGADVERAPGGPRIVLAEPGIWYRLARQLKD